ncbi:MAG: hypothetical protein WDZ85_01465 [Candidatus Paceibacterota bacterium]
MEKAGVVVKIEPAIAPTGRKGRILVYHDGELLVEVVANIVTQIGADGGRYPAVELIERLPDPD